MKRLILTILALSLAGVSFAARYKVVDQSSRQAPIWVEDSAGEYVIVSVINRESLEMAMEELMECVKEQFITTIAQNINSKSLSAMRSAYILYSKSSFQEEIIKLLRENASEISYLNDISEEKILESYWEIRSDKDTKALSYIYSIKYPAPKEGLRAVIAEFESVDEQIAQRYLKLKESAQSIRSVEQIDMALEECDYLIDHIFDNERLKAMANLQRLYSSLYDQIDVVVTDERAGSEATFALKRNGEIITSSSLPMLKYDSESIKSVSLLPIDGEFKLRYDSSLCIENQSYTIQIIFTIGPNRVTHDLHFTHTNIRADIDGSGEVKLMAESVEDSILRGVTVALNIETSDINDFITIDSILLEVESIAGVISIKQPFRVKVSDGVFALKFKCGGELYFTSGGDMHSDFNPETKSESKMVRGTISGSYGQHTTPFIRKIELPYSCNWGI